MVATRSPDPRALLALRFPTRFNRWRFSVTPIHGDRNRSRNRSGQNDYDYDYDYDYERGESVTPI